MKKIMMIIFVTPSLLYAGVGITLKKPVVISHKKDKTKVVSGDYVYILDTKLAHLQNQGECVEKIIVLQKSILKKKKASKKQKKFKCVKIKKKKKKALSR